MKKLNWFYTKREDRSKWLAERFHEEISESKNLLDVGCWNADLKKHIPHKVKYVGVDMAGKADVVFNLDNGKKMPFKNNEYDMVVAADVLEHLENTHAVLEDILRISKKYVIISLPNPIIGLLSYVNKNKRKNASKNEGNYLKFYGLPKKRPEDRHRWMFSYSEAVEFVSHHADKAGFELVAVETDYDYLQKKRMLHKRIFVWALKKFNPDLACQSIIFLLKAKK